MAKQPKQTFMQKLKDSISGQLEKSKNSAAKFRVLINKVTGGSVSGNDIMNDRKRLISMMSEVHLGKMSMFYYDPKWKDQLPYFDRFPLIIPLELYSDGFLGLNLHYLPPGYRATLMDALYNNVYPDKDEITDKKRIRITYNIVKSASRTNLFKPCIKRYLYTHLRSKIYLVPPEDWDVALFLPTQRFEKEGSRKVWQESMEKIRGR